MGDETQAAAPADAATWREALEQGRRGLAVQLLAVGALTVFAIRLRQLVDIRPYALDIDALNFGMGALRYDVPHHMPHPPGYPGWILFLKAVKAVAGLDDPLSIAVVGGILASAAAVPLAWGACRALIRLSDDGAGRLPILRPLAAALLAAVHPVLWYYGGDGQNHSGEAAAALLLLWLATRVRRAPSPLLFAALAFAFGLAGSIRPTASLLCAPLLVWSLWGRPWKSCAAAVVGGAAGVAVWYGPMVALSGGWALYQRATSALVGELYVSNYSAFGARATAGARLTSLNTVVFSLGLCGLPLLAVGPGGRAPGALSWRVAILLVVLANVAFYSLLFIAEPGYMITVAALSCVVPATWGSKIRWPSRLRYGGVLAFTASAMAVLPPTVSYYGFADGRAWVPSLAHVSEMEAAIDAYFRGLCEVGGGEPFIVVTDNPILGHTRLVPMLCPQALSAVYLRPQVYAPEQSGALIYTARDVRPLPTDVVFEAGPPVALALPMAVGRVALATDAAEDYAQLMRAQERCPPLMGADPQGGPAWPEAPMVWDRACMPELRFGESVVRLGP